MSGHLKGKVAIVTGAGRGLGRAHAHALAAAGASIVVNDLGGDWAGDGLDAAPATLVAAEIVAKGGNAVADGSDISDWEGAGAVVETALAIFGGLDILVNNAGIGRFVPIDQATRLDWQRVIDVNLTGTAAMTHWAGAHWRQTGARRGRAIINVSSPAGTNPLPGASSYVASKAGVAALTICHAAELAELGVRVNAIAPIARTRMTEGVPDFTEVMRKPDTGFDRVAPEHVAAVVAWLASDQCAFTGRVFGCEGDDVYLFNGWSAETRVNNGGEPWSVESLANALSDVDTRDRGYIIAPSQHTAGVQPSDSTVAALAEAGSAG